MKPIEIYIEHEEQNGMRTILYLHCGSFMNQVEYLMDLIGTTGVRNKKLNGEIITDYG
jgi:hypothetical protein